MHAELIVILGVNLGCFGFLLFWLRSKQDSDLGSLQGKISESLQKPMLDMTERLGKHFLESQERVDRTLGTNRQELQDGLFKTTRALETKFQSLEAQVGQRLEVIGKNVESKLTENMKEGFKHFEKV